MDSGYFESGTIEDLVVITSCSSPLSILQFDLPYLQILRVKEFKFREVPRTRALAEEEEEGTRDRERSVDNLMQEVHTYFFLVFFLGLNSLMSLNSLEAGFMGRAKSLKIDMGGHAKQKTCPLSLFFLYLMLFCSSTAG